MSKERVYFSEELKVAIVKEIESGKLSQSEACRLYGANRGTLWGWMRQYGKVWGSATRIEVVMSDQKEQIEELKRALAEAHLKLRIYDKMLDVAGKHYKSDLKKTFGTKASELLKEEEKVSK